MLTWTRSSPRSNNATIHAYAAGRSSSEAPRNAGLSPPLRTRRAGTVCGAPCPWSKHAGVAQTVLSLPLARPGTPRSAWNFRIFGRFTPLVEGLSLDEAFLDVSASQSLFGDGETIARQVKAAIVDELRLTASAGVAPSKFVAKIASDLQKPNGLVVVKPGDERAFLEPLPVERMWGIGPKTAARVRSGGLRTLGDLAVAPPGLLEKLFGKWACDVQRLARGEDGREVIPDRNAVSFGAEETFERDISNTDALEAALLANLVEWPNGSSEPAFSVALSSSRSSTGISRCEPDGPR